jgi:excinuclease ABC subunit C
MALEEKIKKAPLGPGVYLFKDSKGQVLYVGKAALLRKRIASYFGSPQSTKNMQMIKEVEDLDWIVTGSEAEALLVEASLIKEHKTKYNILLRDDKSYPSLRITVEEKYPRLYVGRGAVEPGIKVIGPFTQSTLLRQALLGIRKVIPYRTCRTMPQRACLDHYLKLCSAPCEEKISQADYQVQLTQIFRLMEGKKKQVTQELEKKMTAASRQRRYEEAAKYRDQIAGLAQLNLRPRRLVPSEALNDLAGILRLKLPPRRIEGFDISNIYGREAVGSMVTFLDGRPAKAGYKRFKIKTVSGIDDYDMMREVIRRRYDELSEGKGDTPDLVVIDGGKGHLNAALGVLRSLKLNLPAVGIAKEFEQLYLPGQSEPIALPPQSRALQLMQRVRDEAHRFAIGYHRLLRGRHALTSALDHIPGIGSRKKQDLIIRFGSVEGMRKAPVEELAQVRGISPMLAERITQGLKKSKRGKI